MSVPILSGHCSPAPKSHRTGPATPVATFYHFVQILPRAPRDPPHPSRGLFCVLYSYSGPAIPRPHALSQSIYFMFGGFPAIYIVWFVLYGRTWHRSPHRPLAFAHTSCAHTHKSHGKSLHLERARPWSPPGGTRNTQSSPTLEPRASRPDSRHALTMRHGAPTTVSHLRRIGVCKSPV